MCDPVTMLAIGAGSAALGAGAGYFDAEQQNEGIRAQQQINEIMRNRREAARQQFINESNARIGANINTALNVVQGPANPTQILPTVRRLRDASIAANVDPAIATLAASNQPTAAGVRPEVVETKRDLGRQIANRARTTRTRLAGLATTAAFNRAGQDRAAAFDRANADIGLQNAFQQQAAGVYRGILGQAVPQVTIGSDPMLAALKSFGTNVGGNALGAGISGFGNRAVVPRVSGTVQRAPGSFGPGYYGSGTPF